MVNTRAPRPALPPDEGFIEIADRVWVARYQGMDVNVVAVAGEAGLLVVDTLGSEDAARHMLQDLRRATSADVLAVVNTHAHFDHVAGNVVLREHAPEAPVIAHEAAGIDTADTTLVSVRALDLGDRYVEIVHPGRGHTAGDVVVAVPDAHVLVAGDLIEDSGPPAYGPDSYPLEWGATLDIVLGMVDSQTLLVPGHGDVVDQEFLRTQMEDVAMVAQTISDLAGRGVRPEEALDAGEWPFPKEALRDAVTRGYAHLPPGGRRLPMV